MSEPFSWHKEYYGRALKQISSTAGNQYSSFLDEHGEPDIGWLDWFAGEYPEQYKKYDHAIQQIAMLWGDMDPKAMEEFKKAVKVEVDATKWAVEKYLAWRNEQAENDSLKGTQEALAI